MGKFWRSNRIIKFFTPCDFFGQKFFPANVSRETKSGWVNCRRRAPVASHPSLVPLFASPFPNGPIRPRPKSAFTSAKPHQNVATTRDADATNATARFQPGYGPGAGQIEQRQHNAAIVGVGLANNNDASQPSLVLPTSQNTVHTHPSIWRLGALAATGPAPIRDREPGPWTDCYPCRGTTNSVPLADFIDNMKAWHRHRVANILVARNQP